MCKTGRVKFAISDVEAVVCREAISTIIKETCVAEDNPRKELTRRCAIALAWFLASILLAIEIPDIGKDRST